MSDPTPTPSRNSGGPPSLPEARPAPALPEGQVEPEMVEEEDPNDHVSFWADPTVANLTGLATSVLVHAAILIVGIFFLGKVQQIVKDVPQEQTIIPTAELAETNPGGIPHPGMNDDPNRDAEQNIDASVTESDSWNEKKSEELTSSLTQSAEGETSSNSISAYGAKSGAKDSKGLGFGSSNAGGKLARFGTPGGGMGIGPKGPLFGDGGNVTKMVFLCDATGTMIGLKFDLLRRELKSTIGGLTPVQSYNVVFFQDDSFETPDKTKLLAAVPPNNQKVFNFLDKFSVRGQTNPIPGIEQAFKLKPQLIYILSDGEFDNLVGYDEVIKKINTLNADKSVKINTILFGDRDARAEQVLTQIANENGGKASYVSTDDLLKQQK